MSTAKVSPTPTISDKMLVQKRLIGGSMIVLGLLFIAIVGFLPTHTVHNAAHDTRHLSGFPCH